MDLENLCGCGENDCPDCAPAEIRRQDARIAALEAALAAAREENKRLRNLTATEFVDWYLNRQRVVRVDGESAVKAAIQLFLQERSDLAALRASREDDAAAEERGARIVLDAIADTGFFGIVGEYGDYKKRDEFIRKVLAARKDGGAR